MYVYACMCVCMWMCAVKCVTLNPFSKLKPIYLFNICYTTQEMQRKCL